MSASGGKGEQEQAAAIVATLDRMWVKFLPDIRERVQVLDVAAEAAVVGPLREELCAAAQAAAHKLAGTLGTFGLQRGTELARELELLYMRGAIGPDEAPELRKTAAEIRVMIDGRR